MNLLIFQRQKTIACNSNYHSKECFYGITLADTRDLLNHNSRPNLIIIYLNNKWWLVNSQYISQIGGLFFSKTLSSETIDHQTLKNISNCFQTYSYTNQMSNKAFTTPITYNKNSDRFYAHYYKTKILIHKVINDFKTSKFRCTISAIKEHISNNNNLIESSNSIIDTNACPCVSFPKQHFKDIKTEPIGFKNVKNNLEILLNSLGLYKTFGKELKLCSLLAIYAFDIETEYSPTVHTSDETLNQSTGFVNDDTFAAGNILNVFKPLMIGVTHFYNTKQLINIVTSLLPISKRFLHQSNFNFEKQISKVINALLTIDLASYNNLKTLIYNTPMTITYKCFAETSKFEYFIDYIIYAQRLSILVKLIIMFPLIKFLTNIVSLTHFDIFNATLRKLNNWMFKGFIVSFNGARFDNILLNNELIQVFANIQLCKIAFQKSGNSIINMWYKINNRYISLKKGRTKNIKKHTEIKYPNFLTLCFKVRVLKFKYNNL